MLPCLAGRPASKVDGMPRQTRQYVLFEVCSSLPKNYTPLH